jgi:hypothetical protein
MRHGDTTSTIRLAMGLVVALITVLTIPVVEGPSVTALRTSGILVGVAIGVAVLVALWWHLIIRGRRE